MLLLNSFLDYLKYERRCSPNTLLAYKADIELFGIYTQTTLELNILDSPTDLEKISGAMVRAWALTLELERTSLMRRISGVRSFLKYHHKIGTIQVNPTISLKLSQRSRKLAPFIAENSLKKHLNDLSANVVERPDDYEAIRNYCMVEIFYGCGLRRSELLSLTWQCFDLENKVIKITGKGKKQRIIPFNQTLYSIVKRYIQFCENHQINFTTSTFFLTKKGKPMNSTLVYRVVLETLGNQNMNGSENIPSHNAPLAERIHPHLLRHTYATHLVNNGADLNSVKELLGHSNLKATEVYVHNSIQKLKEIHKLAHPKG